MKLSVVACLLGVVIGTTHVVDGFVTPHPQQQKNVLSPSSFLQNPQQQQQQQQLLNNGKIIGGPQRQKDTSLCGIPKMFRWLTDQYPNINRRLSEGLSDELPVDNFYLDMNGIIHPCTHGNAEGEIIVLDETQMFKKIFLYVDRLYKLVKPRQCLYLAVDGVAPRAKMNQQRSRRFRSAKEAEITSAEILAREGQLPEGTKFDSNCITPGTDFMLKLSLALQKWVEYKMQTDPFWQASGADVVVSGPDVPGEGEHKVMDYIREQRDLYVAQKEKGEDPDPKIHYRPEQTHVLYGLDADLIMLGLVTHEPRFMLLREKMSVVMAGRGRNKNRKKKDMMEYDQNDFELLELKSLRQLLSIQFRRFSDVLEGYDLDRVIDDFVFMCMLVGNDFLPHCPHMEIDNGAISMMMTSYIDLLEEWGDYLTKKEKIHPDRFEQFLYHLAVYEEEHFKRRGYEENEPGWQLSAEHEDREDDFYGTYFTGEPTPDPAKPANVKLSMTERNIHNKEGESPPAEEDEGVSREDGKAEKKFKRKHPSDASRSYRDFYYETKMGWSPALGDRDHTLLNRRAQVRDYIEGLHWVLNYYHNGCPAWDWYFPHLYAPLCTDLVNLHEFYTEQDDEGFATFDFDEGKAIDSLAQLLSVLPPQSSDLLPKPLAELMLHPASPLIEFYPQDFTTDPNGKRQPWEAVVQIPFIESGVLRDTVGRVLESDKQSVIEGKDPLFSNAERRRNVRGTSHTFYAPEVEGEPATLRELENLADIPRPKKRRNNNYNNGRNNNGGNNRRRQGPPRKKFSERM